MSTENNNSNQTQLFDDKLRKYEEKLVNFLIDIGSQKRVNPKILSITSFLLIHGSLTQEALRSLTSFSAGCVSTYLTVLVGTGRLQKVRIPGTHTYEYTFAGEGKLENLAKLGTTIALETLSKSEIFLKNKQNQLKELITQSKNGAEHLKKRIDDLLMAFDFYRFFFPKFENIESRVDE